MTAKTATPLTDAIADAVCYGDSGDEREYVEADFARKLETDRARLIEALHSIVFLDDHRSAYERREAAEKLLHELEGK